MNALEAEESRGVEILLLPTRDENTMKTKALKIVSLLLAIVAISALVYAVILATTSFTGTVTVSSTPNLGVYSDALCTTPLTTVSPTFTGAEASATEKNTNFWVKNIGNTPLVVRWTSSGGWVLTVNERYNNPAAAPFAAATFTFFLTTQADHVTRLRPSEAVTPWSISLAMGASVALDFTMLQLVNPPIPAGSNLPTYTIRFDGSDA